MEQIDDFIAKYCSNGVVYKELEKIVYILDSQRRPVAKNQRKKGCIPYYGANGVQDWVDDYIFEGTFLLVGEDGSVITPNNTPVLNWATGKIWVNNHAHVLSEKKEEALLRYVYFALSKTDISSLVKGIPPKLNQQNLKKIKIPLPPMPIQQEIVRILDKYSEFENKLEIKLQEEIDTRKKQYEYYRNRLLSFDSYTIKTKKIQMKPLSEVVCICNGKDHKHLKKGVYPVYGSGGIIRYVDTYIYNDVSVLIPRKGSVGNIFYITTPFWTVDTIFFTKINKDLVEPKYLYYFLLNQHLEKMNLAVGVPSLTKMMLNKIVVAVPSLEEQRKIVELLDNYTSLEKELEIKLQEEIDNRKKQYEYYRNKLLAFSPKLKEDD